jgi:hypothetical protein
MSTRKYTSLSITKEYPVANGNFDADRLPITEIIIHTSVGTIEGVAARFNNPASKVSAHYAVGLNGELFAFLEEFNVAYAAGNYAVNQKSISIEHIDNGDYNGTRPDILYITSAKLVADICKFYSIPIDRQHILKHSEVIATGCPDALDIDRIVRMAQALSNPEPMATITQKDLDQMRADRDSNYNNWQTSMQQAKVLDNQLTTTGNNLTTCITDLTNTKTSLTTCTANLTTCQNTPIPPQDGSTGLLKAKLAQIYTLANKFYFFYQGTFKKIKDLSS